jgi:hypothetical protein
MSVWTGIEALLSIVVFEAAVLIFQAARLNRTMTAIAKRRNDAQHD